MRTAIVQAAAPASCYRHRRRTRAERPGFRVSGKVLERLVDTGQTVRRGQPLMRIDPVDLKLAARAREPWPRHVRGPPRTKRALP